MYAKKNWDYEIIVVNDCFKDVTENYKISLKGKFGI